VDQNKLGTIPVFSPANGHLKIQWYSDTTKLNINHSLLLTTSLSMPFSLNCKLNNLPNKLSILLTGISDALSSSKSLEAGFIQDWFSSVNSLQKTYIHKVNKGHMYHSYTASLLKLSSLSATQKAMNRCQQQVIE
jgi:hypothetical protein